MDGISFYWLKIMVSNFYNAFDTNFLSPSFIFNKVGPASKSIKINFYVWKLFLICIDMLEIWLNINDFQ